jgi:hypothetical protein
VAGELKIKQYLIVRKKLSVAQQQTEGRNTAKLQNIVFNKYTIGCIRHRAPTPPPPLSSSKANTNVNNTDFELTMTYIYIYTVYIYIYIVYIYSIYTHTSYHIQWRIQEFLRGGVRRGIFFSGGGGGSTNSVEDREQTEWGYGGVSPLVRGSTQFANE